MVDPITRMTAREIEERYHEYPKAARAMLAALEALCGVYEGYEDVPLYVRKARAAIAAAKAAGIGEDK